MTDSNRPLSLLGTTKVPNTSRRCWVPPGKTVSVQEHEIPGGMIYVGAELPSVDCEWVVDPALINPKLQLRSTRPTEPMPYWPSYSELPPEHRARFLDWMAAARCAPSVEIGYVFLFFYGLERRALFDAEHDATARSERPAIRAEAARLLSIYGDNRSFRTYASAFLDILDASSDAERIQPHKTLTKPGDSPTTYAIQRALATCALSQTPLPVSWALAWLHLDPRTRLRTPAKRCRTEFDTLFRIRYAEEFGAGMIIKPCKRTLTLAYRPASSGLRHVDIPTTLPDIIGLTAPHRRLQELATACCDDLGSYSRYIGKHPDQRGSLNAFALMPPDLVQHDGQPMIASLRESVDTALASAQGGVFLSQDLLGEWIDGDLSGLGKRESLPLIQLLGHAGYGLEPDVRLGGPPLNRSAKVCVFRLGKNRHESPSSAYSAAALLLQLAVTVSAADGDLSSEEEQHLEEHLSSSLHLDGAEQLRLHAHLQWLLADPPRLAGLKKRVAALSAHQRRQAALLLVEVAWADGTVEPSEVKMLQRIYKLLELDPETVHQDLHEARGEPIDTGPVVVARRQAPPTGYAIPPQPTTPSTPSSKPKAQPAHLDDAVIAAKLKQTAAVSSLLETIFADEDAPAPTSTPAPSSGSEAGPDALHVLLQRLGTQATWGRAEYDALAQELDLLPDGALESLNDLAFEKCEDPLWEGDDPIEINLDIHQELVA